MEDASISGTINHRRSIRLKGYDYAQAGAYFVTICAQDRVSRFGEIVNGEMRLADAGRMVLDEWRRLPARFPGVELDMFVVMPDHVHAIFLLGLDDEMAGATTRVAPTNRDGAGSVDDGDDTMPGNVTPRTGDAVPDKVGAGLVPALAPTNRDGAGSVDDDDDAMSGNVTPRTGDALPDNVGAGLPRARHRPLVMLSAPSNRSPPSCTFAGSNKQAGLPSADACGSATILNT